MDPEEEVQRIEHDLSCEEKGSFAELFQGRFRKAGIFVVGLGFLVQITGIEGETRSPVGPLKAACGRIDLPRAAGYRFLATGFEAARPCWIYTAAYT
jgi:hypothetical protein